MKLEMTVFKERAAPKSGKGFGGREVLAEGLLGTRFIGRLSGIAEGEVSGGSVEELVKNIAEKLGRVDWKENPELQFRFDQDGPRKAQLGGDEISEFFRGIESLRTKG